MMTTEEIKRKADELCGQVNRLSRDILGYSSTLRRLGREPINQVAASRVYRRGGVSAFHGLVP